MDGIWERLRDKKEPIAVVGLGYVGLPLAALLARHFRVVGFDVDAVRVQELGEGLDRTKEVEDSAALMQETLSYSADPNVLGESPFIIVAVPTPIDRQKKPDTGPLLRASESIGAHLRKGTVVVYESTVYPGLTESLCREALEQASGLKHGEDFWLGYSPERINPGDREHTIDKIVKVVAGSTPEVASLLEKVYGAAIPAGIHKAPSIAAAEAAKVIENTQRDLNIALINELAQIFDRIGIDTRDVLAAARTKWNFVPFEPGLVGGHCIGVDPYYLTHMAESVGHHPQVILAGRRINDQMGKFVADKAIKMILRRGGNASAKPKVAVLGATFKEDVPDLRNTRSRDIIESLEEYGAEVYCVDPVCDPKEYSKLFSRSLTPWEDLPACDAVIVAVRHSRFARGLTLGEIATKINPATGVLLDLKGMFDRNEAAQLGLQVWRL